MAKTIKYQKEDYKCLTPCPYREGIKVGSGWCQTCRYLVGIDDTNLVVDCEYE